MRHYEKVVLFLFLLTLCIATVAGALRSQDQAQPEKSGQQTERADLPVLDVGAPEGRDQKKREAKGKKYNKDSSVVSPELVRVSEFYHWPADFPAIPVTQSNVIVLGYVTDARAYLSSDQTGVYSEFTIKISEVLKDSTAEPLKSGDSTNVERDGGRVRYPTGHVVQFSIVGFGMPLIGHRYLLFIKKDEANSQIVTGYELAAGAVSPLDQSGTVNFNKYKGWKESAFLDEVRTAITSDPQSLSR